MKIYFLVIMQNLYLEVYFFLKFEKLEKFCPRGLNVAPVFKFLIKLKSDPQHS